MFFPRVFPCCSTSRFLTALRWRYPHDFPMKLFHSWRIILAKSENRGTFGPWLPYPSISYNRHPYPGSEHGCTINIHKHVHPKNVRFTVMILPAPPGRTKRPSGTRWSTRIAPPGHRRKSCRQRLGMEQQKWGILKRTWNDMEWHNGCSPRQMGSWSCSTRTNPVTVPVLTKSAWLREMKSFGQ